MSRIKTLWKTRDKQYIYIKWLLQYVKPYLGKILLMMLINLISIGASLLMVNISKNIIDNATFGNGFVRLLVGYVVLMICMQALGVFTSLFSTLLNEKFSFGIRKQIYEKIINSHWMEVKAYHTGDLMTRLTSDAGNIADGLIGTIPNICILLMELVLVFFTLFSYSPFLAVLALLVAPVAAITCWWFGKKLKTLQKKVQ